MTDEERRALEGLRDHCRKMEALWERKGGESSRLVASAYDDCADELDTFLRASRSREQETEDQALRREQQ